MNLNVIHLIKPLLFFVICLQSFTAIETNEPGSNKAPVSRNLLTVSQPTVPSYCHQDLLTSLGFEGYKSPQKRKLEMCMEIEYSCCTREDQANIYAKWVLNKEEENLQKLFERQKEVYSELLDQATKVHVLAKKTAAKLRHKRVSNCKILARRISHFEIPLIAPKLLEALTNMQDYFFKVYKGFYCTVCDATMQPFILIEDQKFIFSEKFCRDLTSRSLHVLVYFYYHFAKYLNIVTRFVTSCSVKGQYKRNTAKIAKFKPRAKTIKIINKCKNQRNNKNWFENCQPICDKFQITRFVDYFAPNIKRYHRYNRFLKKEMNRLDKEEALLKMLEAKEKKSKKIRLLSEGGYQPIEPTTDPFADELDARLNDMIMFKEDPVVLKTAVDAGTNFDEFESTYQMKGIDLYYNGDKTIMSESIFLAIKADKTAKTAKKEMEAGGETENTLRIIVKFIWAAFVLLLIK